MSIFDASTHKQVSQSMDALAHTKVILQPGNYEVHVTADVAFLITFGFVSLARAQKDIALLGDQCSSEVSSRDVP